MEYTKWEYREGQFNYSDHGCNQKGSIVCDGWFIATIEGSEEDGMPNYKDTANLIVAAPDLYEALEALIKAEDEGLESLGYGRSKDARQAIAKAEVR